MLSGIHMQRLSDHCRCDRRSNQHDKTASDTLQRTGGCPAFLLLHAVSKFERSPDQNHSTDRLDDRGYQLVENIKFLGNRRVASVANAGHTLMYIINRHIANKAFLAATDI